MQETRSFGCITFDSAIHCGCGHGFKQIAPDTFRFWSREGMEPYSWRFYFKIVSPGTGREIVLEVADFNNTGNTKWHEGATCYSTNRELWREFGPNRLEIVPYTPPVPPAAYGDSTHEPYGVRYKLKLTHPEIWIASPTPFTLENQDILFERILENAPDNVRLVTIGETYHSAVTGYGMKGIRISDFSVPAENKLRCFVIAGEHPSESAGIYACAGMMKKFVNSPELLKEFDICFMTLSNPDGIFYGRTYHNTAPDDPGGKGYNILLDYHDELHPETRNISRFIAGFKPHVFLRLHNGRHRKTYDCWINDNFLDSPVVEELRAAMSLEIDGIHPASARQDMVYEKHGVPVTITFETLLLEKNPGFDNFKNSYIRTGEEILNGITVGLWRIKPKLNRQ